MPVRETGKEAGRAIGPQCWSDPERRREEGKKVRWKCLRL